MPSVAYQIALGWKNPGRPGSEQERIWKLKYLVRADAVPVVKTLWVHKAVRVQFNALNLFLQRNGAELGKRVDDWGFANRDIRGYPGTKSYHAFGLAEDLDAVENPLGVRATTFPEKKTRRVANLLGFKWGLDYSGRPDPMHFEFIKSVAAARYIRSRLLKPTKKSRELAVLCDMDLQDFINRIK